MTLLPQHEVKHLGSATGKFLDFLNEFLFLLHELKVDMNKRFVSSRNVSCDDMI